jgi:hypothetical protein
MKRVLLAVAVLLSFLAVSAKAQNRYAMPAAPFVCDAASRYPVTSFYQFSCRGIKLTSDGTTVVGSFFLFSNSLVEVTLTPLNISPDPGDYFNSYVTKLDLFTEPSANGPGTFQFEWQEDDANEIHHTGTASGTWEDYVICGGRGCQWHAPKLLTLTTTAN